MNKYINQETGAVIYSPCFISGGAYVLYDSYTHGRKEAKPVPTLEAEMEKDAAKESPALKEKNEEGKMDQTNLTVAEIKNELDAFGIKYDKSANKKALLALLKEAMEE